MKTSKRTTALYALSIFFYPLYALADGEYRYYKFHDLNLVGDSPYTVSVEEVGVAPPTVIFGVEEGQLSYLQRSLILGELTSDDLEVLARHYSVNNVSDLTKVVMSIGANRSVFGTINKIIVKKLATEAGNPYESPTTNELISILAEHIYSWESPENIREVTKSDISAGMFELFASRDALTQSSIELFNWHLTAYSRANNTSIKILKPDLGNGVNQSRGNDNCTANYQIVDSAHSVVGKISFCLSEKAYVLSQN